MKYKSFPLPSFDAAFAIFVTLVAVMGVFFILISTFWTRRQSNGMFKREILCKFAFVAFAQLLDKKYVGVDLCCLAFLRVINAQGD